MGISASASSTIQTGWNLSVSFEETGTSTPNNTSNIRCDARLAPASSAYMFDYYGAGTLTVYWHDNNTNTDRQVASVGVQTCSASQNATCSGTITATHKADGTLSGYAKATWTKSYNSQWIPASGNVSTATKALTNIPRKSKPTVSSTAIVLPSTDTLTVTTNRAASSFTHTITLKIGDVTIEESTGVGASITYNLADIQDDIFAQMSTINSATMTVICRTYSGSTDLGTEQTTVAVSISDDAAPIFSAFTFADTNSDTIALTGDNQVLISAESVLTAYISAAQAATAQYGATMSSYTFTINATSQSQAYSSSAITKILGPVTLPATTTENQALDLVVSAIDSRGKSTSVTQTVVVIPWRAPIINASAVRTNGFEAETTITANGSVSPLLVAGVGKNNVNSTNGLQYRYKSQSTSTWGSWTNIATTYNSTTGAVSSTSFKINLDNQTAYDMEFKLTDILGSSTGALTVSQGQPAMYIGSDDRRVSIGGMPTIPKVAGKDGQLEVLGNVYSNGKKLISKDEVEAFAAGFPIGTILPYSGNGTPDGYLACDGSAVSRSTYADLYAVIGTAYGSGDGSTTFNLPNLKGKVPVGQDTSDTSFDTIGETGGEKSHKLVVSEMPKHQHRISCQKGTPGNSSWDYGQPGNGWNASAWNPNPTEPIGGDGYHNNLQPYIVINYIIKFEDAAGTIAEVKNVHSTSTTDVYSANYVNGIIPTVNNGTLTITQNGTVAGTFTANSASNTTIDLTGTTYTAGTGIDITGTTVAVDTSAVSMKSEYTVKKSYTIDLSAQSTSNFYPVVFPRTQNTIDCEIHSEGGGSGIAYNQNVIHFNVCAQGWSDLSLRKKLIILQEGTYDSNEITIGCIGLGQQAGYTCIWLRGGIRYFFTCNFIAELHTSDYTISNETFSVGTNYYGGTNANVDIVRTPNQFPKDVALLEDVDARANLYRYTKSAYNSSSNSWYYPIATLPIDNSNNSCSVIINGRIGGWTNSNMAKIDLLLTNRSDYTGNNVTASGSIKGPYTGALNTTNVVVYKQTDKSAIVYLKCDSYFAFDLTADYYQATKAWTGNYTTSPSGTLIWSTKTTNALEKVDTDGCANRASTLYNYYKSRPTTANLTAAGNGGLFTFQATGSMTTAKPKNDAHIIHLEWDNTGGWDSQIAVNNNGNSPWIAVRAQDSGTWKDWVYLLNDADNTVKTNNINALAVTTAKIADGAVTADKIASGVIPTVNDTTITITQNGTTLGTFTTNTATATTIDIPSGGGGGGSFTTLWTNSNTNNNFGAQSVPIANLDTYKFIDILVIPYKGGNQNTIHVVRHYYDGTRTRGEISQPFRYNNSRFYGSRIFTVTSTGVAFDYAYNDANQRADDWYIPWKIIGYK